MSNRAEELRKLRKFDHWLGERKEGEWVPEAVSTDTKRRFEHHTRNRLGKVVKVQTEELVYMHHGYRPHMEGEKQTRKAFFFRGARVWRK